MNEGTLDTSDLILEIALLRDIYHHAKKLSEDLDLRWPKDHPHRKVFLDPLLSAIQQYEGPTDWEKMEKGEFR